MTDQDIVFFGTEDFSLLTLRALIESGFSVKCVVTKPDTRRGRKKLLTEPPVKTYAREQGIAVLQPVRLQDIADDIKQLTSPAGVLVSYGKIIPKDIIDLFSPGIINLHPSLLPSYRGPSPIESAIINGDATSGISIMQLSAAMDAGPVYYQEVVALDGTETQGSLYDQLGTLGSERLIQKLPDILSGSLQPAPQNDQAATYCQLLKPADAVINPLATTAAEFERHIRAYQLFPRTKINWRNHTLIITRGHVTAIQKSPLDIKCRDGAFLSIDECIAPSGKRMDSDAFLRGYAAG